MCAILSRVLDRVTAFFPASFCTSVSPSELSEQLRGEYGEIPLLREADILCLLLQACAYPSGGPVRTTSGARARGLRRYRALPRPAGVLLAVRALLLLRAPAATPGRGAAGRVLRRLGDARLEKTGGNGCEVNSVSLDYFLWDYGKRDGSGWRGVSRTTALSQPFTDHLYLTTLSHL